ncbi:MAG: glutamate-1-semialdehyde-2,1-aminomutase [Legionellales bacterium]|nr:MAG: glutamate-1-semialdehyde-2,1-aminomutase [Legionellales bacterium]
MPQNKSQLLLQRAIKVIPGGVNSPVRAFKGVYGTPIFLERGHGPYVISVDNTQYIDYVGSWGPQIHGHNNPKIAAAIATALQNSTGFGAPTPNEVHMAELITDLIPSIEMVRMVNSGTEATMSAIRLARGFTGRDKIIKFTGCYHGHSDSLLVKAGSGLLTLGIPDSAGVPQDSVKNTLTAPFNNIAAVQELFDSFPNTIATVIIEPIPGNMNLVLPKPGFLAALKKLCAKYDTLLIFDEVMTGFRVALGGAQQLYDIKPDLTCLGKIIGGGLPVGAFGGRKDIMECLAPIGAVYQAGTLSGNPVTMAAGIASLQLLQQENFYKKLATNTEYLANGIRDAAKQCGIGLQVNSVPGMLGILFSNSTNAVTDYATVMNCNMDLFKRFHAAMLEHGIYLPPSGFETWFVSGAHNIDVLENTLQAAIGSLKKLL